jgi:hypothetical protein
MSLILTSLVVAGGVMMGRWIARSALPKSEEDEEDEAAVDGKGAPVKPVIVAVPPVKEDPLLNFSCHLGDVVMRAGGEEAWLAGAILFSEESPAAVLFIAPDAGGDRALFLRPKPAEELAWLMPIAENELELGVEPPSSLEHKGDRFDRVRRLPFRAERLGTGAPDVGQEVVLAEYKSLPGERVLVIVGSGMARAWRGMLLEPGMYDVLASGKSTLEES